MAEVNVNQNLDTNFEDLQIENNALKELLAENKKTIEELNKTMVEVKASNAKLLSQLDVSKQSKSLEEMLNENFNKYFKRKEN